MAITHIPADTDDVRPGTPLTEYGSGDLELEDTSADRIKEPFDPQQIRIRTTQMTVDLVLSRIANGELQLDPDFQRQAGIWTKQAQSRLIESLLMRIPLPSFYLDAVDDERWVVIDGLQRLTALRRFVSTQDLRLGHLEFLAQFNGCKYEHLPRPFQRRIQETVLTVFIVEQGTPDQVKFNIFRRINTGGLPLTAQEIRHALNQGAITALLARLADSDAFQQATCRSVQDHRMAARECALRFLAFARTPYTAYTSGDFDEFLSRQMAELNRLAPEDLVGLSTRFERALRASHRIMGEHAFRKVYEHDGRKLPVNKALFEAWTVNLDRLTDAQLDTLAEASDAVVDRFIALLRDTDSGFEAAVSASTGDPAKVRLRFEGIERLLQGLLG